MNMKNLLLFSIALVGILLIGNVVSAATEDLATITAVKVNGLYTCYDEDISVVAGETVPIEVYFTSEVNASDIRIKAEMEGEKVDITDRIGPFDVEEGKRYLKTLHIKIPYELKDEISDDISLDLKIWNDDYKTVYPEITLRVQRPSYNVDVLSIESDNEIEAGDNFFVAAVIKNRGYNDLDDLFVKLKIPALGVEKTVYAGDLVAVECTDCDDDDCCNEDDQDAVQAKFYVKIPYETTPGVYTLEVEAKNDDLDVKKQKQISIKNNFASGNLLVSTLKKTFSVDEKATYQVLVVNPTNKLKVYRVVVDSPSGLNVEGDALAAIPAGASKSIELTASANKAGVWIQCVSLFSGEDLVGLKTVQASVISSTKETTTATDPMVILTIVLAVVFIVLLVILIVLLGKKPEKQQEEFGESYY